MNHRCCSATRGSAALLVAAAFFFVIALPADVARADEPQYSKYEQQTIDLAVKDLKQAVDPAPQGKVIEDVIIRRLDVFEPRDPLPHVISKFLDWFHATSKEFTISRQLLIHRGDTWDQSAVDETARNLRALPQLSLVLAIALKGSTPDRVKLLLVTKDVWSLRLNSDIRAESAGLERLLLQPSEENLGGIHHAANLLFLYEPATLTFGAGYAIPRIDDSHLLFDVGANLIFNKHTGKLEGSSGVFSYGQPLYSTKAKWSYGANLTWLEEITRRFIGVDEAAYVAKTATSTEKIPYEYSTDSLAASFKLTRSFGDKIKHDFTAGLEAKSNVFRPTQTNVDPVALHDFVTNVIPVTDKRVYPFLEYETYSTKFMAAHDLETLALEENFRVGHDVYVKVYPVLTALASSRTYLGVAAGAAYTVKLGDGFARAYADVINEADTKRVYDGRVDGGLRISSPRFYIGRLIFDGTVTERYQNFLNDKSLLGGGDRLRGYPTGAFIGDNAFAWNLEYRSRPFEILTIQVGAALFWDTGATFDKGEFPDLKHVVGVGLRVLLPQLERTVVRLDWAFPLVPAPDVGVTKPWPGNLVFTFDQAFDVPHPAPPSVN